MLNEVFPKTLNSNTCTHYAVDLLHVFVNVHFSFFNTYIIYNNGQALRLFV